MTNARVRGEFMYIAYGDTKLEVGSAPGHSCVDIELDDRQLVMTLDEVEDFIIMLRQAQQVCERETTDAEVSATLATVENVKRRTKKAKPTS